MSTLSADTVDWLKTQGVAFGDVTFSYKGTPISGLYAADEVANGKLLNHQYPCSGTSIQICATMGRQAGAAAVKTAKG